MVFLIIHNEYQHRGGEESVVDFQKNLLEQHGHKVILYTRNYHELGDSSWGRIKSIFTHCQTRKAECCNNTQCFLHYLSCYYTCIEENECQGLADCS